MNQRVIFILGLIIAIIASFASTLALSTRDANSAPRPATVAQSETQTPDPETEPQSIFVSELEESNSNALLFDVIWLDPNTIRIRISEAGCVRNISYSQACLTSNPGEYLIMPRPNQDWAYHPYRANSIYAFWSTNSYNFGEPEMVIYVPYELPRYLPIISR